LSSCKQPRRREQASKSFWLRTGLVLFFLGGIGGVLAACGLTSSDTLEQPPTGPQSVIDRVRSLDLLPRNPRPGTTAVPSAPGSSQPSIYDGANVTPVAEVRADAPTNGVGFDLNFENAPIATVAKIILGDILGVGYTIDQRVQATLSLASGRPIAKSDMLFVLENALRMNNIALVRDPVGYRLVPINDAIGSAPLNRLGTVEAGYGVSVIPLQYVSAQTMLKLLENFATRPGMVRADATRNLILVQGTGAERKNTITAVLSFDADWMRGQSVGVFPVRNSAVETLVAEIEKILDTGEGGLTHNLVKLQPITRMNAILVVSRKPELIRTAGQWIYRLDQSDTAGTNLKVYRLRYGNARQVAALLTEIFFGRTQTGLDTNTAQIAPGSQIAPVRAPLTALGVTSTPAGQPAVVPNLRAATAAPADQSIAPAADTLVGASRPGAATAILQNVRITADVANNSLLVYANQENHRIVEQTIRQIDRPQLQVSIDATIAEITLNNTLNYGVQFFLKSKDIGAGDDKGSVINSIGNAVLARSFPGFNFLLGSSAEPRLILDALHAVTEVKVLSTPSVVVLDNQVATLQVGDQVPVSTGTATVLTANNTVVSTIDYRSTGVILRVQPRINSNGTVVLDIEQEISNVASSTPANSLTPTVSQRKVKSSISVTSGQTVLLAGLISEQENLTRQGIPLLDQLPRVGDLFAHQNRAKVRTELIIFIRPQIIRNAVDANLIAEELRTKLNGQLIGSAGPPPPLIPFR